MSRHFRNAKALILIAMLILAGILAAAHNRAVSQGRPSSVEIVVLTIAKPFQSAASGIGNFFSGIRDSLRSRRAIRSENERLREELRRLNLEVMRLREDAAEAARLREAFSFKNAFPEKLLAARIISREPSSWFVTATINRGSSSGVQPAQAVITPRGLVGQVYSVSKSSAQIRAITDPQSGVGGMVQRSRAIGLCLGKDPDTIEMSEIAKDADIAVGDVVVTSGIGGVIPKGVPIGRVTKVFLSKGGFTKTAWLRPSVRIDQTEECFIVIKKVD